MNIQGMMKKAQQMQKKITDVQTEFEAREIEGHAGGGSVKITINGKKQVLKLAIDPALIDPTDKEMLEDTLIAAINDAGNKADTLLGDEMNRVSSSLGLPAGMKLPF